MKVILLQDIENLGKKDEIKEVADGYARNFLLPNNLVKPATEPALEELNKKKELETKLAEEELKQIEELISKIDGQEIDILVKIKDNGEIFGSITPFKISQALKKKGFDIKKEQVNLKEQIKKMGEYPVTINFEHGLEAEIKVIIADEKAEKEIKEES
jgi:large subunit ribosomal protein L9